MTTCTDQKQKTAVELFQTGDDTIHRQLTMKLESLLIDGTDDHIRDEYHHLTLQEFQENFEWEESYVIEVYWKIFVLYGTFSEVECKNREEFLSYINGDLSKEKPDFNDELLSDYNPEITVNDYDPGVDVTNLRLKSKEPSKKFESNDTDERR